MRNMLPGGGGGGGGGGECVSRKHFDWWFGVDDQSINQWIVCSKINSVREMAQLEQERVKNGDKFWR